MGTCLSKKTTHCSSPSALPDPPDQTKTDPLPLEKKKPQEDSIKKEIFVIKHRRSHEIDREEKPKSDLKPAVSASPATPEAPAVPVNGGLPNGGVVVRTSSCTKEEVDAILIQCGRLSRSSSTGKANLSGSGDNNNNGSAQRGRKYSGSKRSYDFDNETSNSDDKDKKIGDGFDDAGDDVIDGDRIHRHRQRHRQSKPSSGGRRRTPSRERDQQQQRSGSRERGGSGGGGGSRRVSRSPGRRSESPLPGASASSANPTRPGKMVSVPATVSSMAMDKSNNGGGVAEPPPAATSTVKRIAVKRNVGDPANTGCRTAASPRSRSPARTNLRGGNENQIGQQPVSLSRSNSRKAEHSPYRRNPLGEIDQNSIGFEATHQPINKPSTITQSQKPNVDNARATKVVNNMGSAPENSKPQGLTRSRSSRLSRDLDLNPETLGNPTPTSYTALLLEDIQNFHQKTTTPAAVSLPACISKACSIVEAVADLNSSSGSSRSDYFNKKRLEAKDPVVESEMLVKDDLMEPSFHKYVTVRKGIAGGKNGGEIEVEEESSGSNSIAGPGQQYFGSSSSTWEPTSADSTDRWTSSGTRDSGRSPLGFEREAFSESRMVEKKREPEQQQQQHVGIGRNRLGYSKGLHSTTTTTLAAAST